MTINSRTCTAITKKGKPCPFGVEQWRELSLCHVHDPQGTFRKQQNKKGYKHHTYTKDCDHKWYMREKGITCIKCLIIWEKEMDEKNNLSSL